MSMEMYEQTMRKLSIYRDIELSESDVRSGRVADARESLNKIKEKYGI